MPTSRPWRFWLAAPLLAALAGCPGPSQTAVSYPGAYPSPAASADAISGLVQKATAADAELKDNLTTPVTLNFPVRLGILLYAYGGAMQPEDQQAVLDGIRADLAGSGLVKSSVLIPSSLVDASLSLEDIRKLVSRFGVDTLLIVSGSTSFQRAAVQNPGFFDQFTNRAAYEARASVGALGMNVLTGRFLTPFQVAGKAGPEVLNPDDAAFSGRSYELKKQAETQALNALRDQVLAALRGVAAQPSPGPTASAAPSPSPTVPPSPSATP